MRELARLGIEVHVALPAGPLVSEYCAHGIHVHEAQFDLSLRAPHNVYQRALDLRHLVAQVQPNLIHSHFVGTTLMMRMALGRNHPLPRVFQVPGPLHLEHPFFRRGELALAGTHDYWIGSCHWTSNAYRRFGVPSNRVFMSHYGTDVDAFGANRSGKLRAEISADSNTKIIGMVAYMYAPKKYLGQSRGLKGHEDFIDAFAHCLTQREDILGVIVGGAWNGAHAYEQAVRDYAQRRCGDKIVFLGSRSDVAQLYPDFDLAVHPSHSENLGGAVESMLAGVPTIATNVGGFPDIVRHQETGWLVPPREPDALAATMLHVLDAPNEAQTYARRGNQLVKRVCDVRHTAREVYEIYHQILGATLS